MTDGSVSHQAGSEQPLVAYFSMEIGIAPGMPTYAGGLGMLAGDTIRSAADLDIPMVAVTLLHRRGYFYQRLDEHGFQREEPVAWPIDDFCRPIPQRVTIEIENRTVHVGAWQIPVRGETGGIVPVYLLDTDLPENDPWDRTLTDSLYGGDDRYRLCQEVVLGFGGYRLLKAIGYHQIRRFHLNEGHAALLVLAILEEKLTCRASEQTVPGDLIEAVREQCVFTTHTPVPAGHDQFASDLARRVLGERRCLWLDACHQTPTLNMTQLALRGSRFINGVAMKHGEVSTSLFPGYPIHSITNGVHAVTWAAPSFQALFDRRLPDWRRDQLSLRYAIGIPTAEIWDAHTAAKRDLIDYVNREANGGFDRDVLTIGCARRATAYKRCTLIFHDLERLIRIVERAGPVQIIFGGKAHPRDFEGKAMIRRIHEISGALRGRVPVVYLPNYDMALARLMCAGCDVWLNTPLPPMEASGTSGMKAAVNGVPSLSVLDGWWIEGHLEDVTGWSIGDVVDGDPDVKRDIDDRHAAELCHKLETKIIPTFYHERDRFLRIMRYAIAVNGGFFNSQRMVLQYLHKAYRLTGEYVRRR